MKMYNQTQISPEGTYIYALNMVNKSEGTVGELQDEVGNDYCFEMPEGYKLIGTIETPKKKTFVFLQGSTFKIWEIKGCTFVELLDSECFTYTHAIKGEYRIINENQEIIYWYDGFEPDRYFNISHPEYHVDCDSYLLKPNFTTPMIRMVDLSETGGNLPTSAYSIKARYVDKVGNVTDWFSETLPYPISASGSFNNPVTVEGTDINKPTNKALIYKLWNVDLSYPFVEIAVNKYTDEYTVQSFSYGKFTTESEMQISITSINNLSLITYKTTTVPTAKYETSRIMLQNDNRLVRGNLTSKFYDWGKFQIAANLIQPAYITNILLYDSQPQNQDNNPDAITGEYSINYNAGNKSGYAYSNKSLMRDEVYAAGIVWIMKDGSESPVFHIPGREKNRAADGADAPFNYEVNLHNRIVPYDGWDSSLYNTIDYSDADIFATSSGGSEFERWQVYNTAYWTDSGYKQLAYYECRDLNNVPILYPDTRDCDGNLIYPNDGGDMLPIRHLKTPDCTLEPHYGYDNYYGYIQNVYYTYPLYFIFNNISPPAEYADDVVSFKIVIGDRTDDKTIVDKGILGTIIEQNYNQNPRETVTDTVKDMRKGYIQSMQFSHDNQTPKSYSLQTGLEFVGAGGNESMMCIPACSETISYAKENCEEVGDLPVATAIRLLGYHSPLSKLKETEMNGTHIKWEREIYTNLDNNGLFNNTKSNEFFNVLNNRKNFKNRETKNLLTTNVYYRFEKTYIPFGLLTNRVIKNSVFVNADSTFNGNTKVLTTISTDKSGVFNNKTQQEVNIIQVEGSQDDNPYLAQYWRRDDQCTSPTTFTDPTNVDKNQWAVPATYTAAFNFQLVEDISNIFDKGGWMSHNYVAIKRYKTDCYRDLTKIKYLDYSNQIFDKENTSADVYAGDIFICRFAFRQTFYGYVPHTTDMSTGSHCFGVDLNNSGGGGDLISQVNDFVNEEVNAIFESKIIDTYYESDINIEWREHNDDVWNNTYFKYDDAAKKNESYDAANATVKTNLFFPKYYGDKGSEYLLLELNSNAISRLKNNGEWKFYELFKNYYKLNDVYNVKAPNYRLLPLAEYRCDTNLFPNRVIWSEKSNNEERKDTYRRFLANNYKDIEGNTSYITDIFEKRGNLYLHTNESLFHLPRTSEQLQLRDVAITIGTGEYLSLPQIQLTNTNYNFSGQQGRFNRFTTEYGTFFVNQEQGMVYNFGENLESISGDMQQWFYNNLPSELNQAFIDRLLFEYPFKDDLTNSLGIGLQSTIDYNLGRWILHKRDYEPILPLLLYSNTQQPSTDWTYWCESIVINGTLYNNVFAIYSNFLEDYQIIDFSERYFINRSWTLSYDMESKAWISYHTYQPDWMYQDGNNFYTYKWNVTWKHGFGGQRTFYNQTYDGRIEWQVSKQKEIVDGISYVMRCQYYDPSVKQWLDYDADFTKGFLYNTYQTTYMFNTTNDEYYLWSDFNKKINIRERIRTINGFRQLNDDIPVIVSDWDTLQLDYQGYEPYTVIPTPPGYVQNFSKMNSIRDIFTNARMYLQLPPWFRIRWQMVDTQRTKSIR
jgi:hypothetical protein